MVSYMWKILTWKVSREIIPVYENLPISSSSYENDILKNSYWNTFYFLRYAPVRSEKSLFINIQKQYNMLKISLLFKKFTNFKGKYLESS